MALHSELSKEAQQLNTKYLDARWEQLWEIEKESADQVLRYLLFINSGGAIATLSFLGASSVAFGMKSVKVALCLFLLGVLIVGIAYALQFHLRSRIFRIFREASVSYYQNKLSIEDLLRNDEGNSKESLWEYIFPYGALSCFVVGCIFGVAALLCGA